MRKSCTIRSLGAQGAERAAAGVCSQTLYTVAAQARAIDRIFEILIVGAKPRHSGQAAGANQ